MQSRYDDYTKRNLRSLLRSSGEVGTQEGLESEAQHVDLTYMPDPGKESERAALGWLGKMVEKGPTMLEFYHDTPSVEEWRDCLHKQSTWHQSRRREFRRIKKKDPPYPSLWILSSGKPVSVVRGFGLAASEAPWPVGFYDGDELEQINLVVLRELPETEDTLLLRLVGAGKTLNRAIREVLRRPPNDRLRELIVPLLLALRIEGPHTESTEDLEVMQSLEEIYQQVTQEAQQRGLQIGEQRGLQIGEQRGLQMGAQQAALTSICRIYRRRFGSLSPELEAAFQRIEDPAQLQDLIELVAVGEHSEILAALHQ